MTNIQTKNDEQGRIIINSWEEVPQFQNETEEQAWWDKHTPSEQLLEQFTPVSVEGDETLPPARQTKASNFISVNIERDVLKRLQKVAQKKQIDYQELLKEFVLERLYEEEKREGIL